MSEKMIVYDVILTELGLITLSEKEREQARAKVINSEKLTLDQLKH